MPGFWLTLRKAYYDKGFFNVPVDMGPHLGHHGELVTLVLGASSETVETHLNCTANSTHAPRVMPKAKLRDWFQSNYDLKDLVYVDVSTPGTIVMSDPSQPNHPDKQKSMGGCKDSEEDTVNMLVHKCVELVRDGLRPYVERQFAETYGSQWQQELDLATRRKVSGQGQQERAACDVQGLTGAMKGRWNEVFRHRLDARVHRLVSDVWDIRCADAHAEDQIPWGDAYRGVDSIYRLLAAIQAPQAKRVDQVRDKLLARAQL